MAMIKNQKGEVTLLGVIIVVAVLVVVALIIVATTNQSSPPPPSQAPGTTSTCFTYSLGLLEFQCGDNKFMGASFGIWDCKAGIGAHQCK
ncbi:hypothetical protein [Porticoccus sp.]